MFDRLARDLDQIFLNRNTSKSLPRTARNFALYASSTKALRASFILHPVSTTEIRATFLLHRLSSHELRASFFL